MNNISEGAQQFNTFFLSTFILLVAVLSGCKPDGFINKVNYKGEKYVNTCETFKSEVEKLIEANNDPLKIYTSQYDNADFAYYYLEPGQFEIKNDTLIFRLEQDLNYPKYLAKGVSVHVNVSYKAVERIKDLETIAEENLGRIVVDRKYYVKNRKPFFVYLLPLKGAKLAGKQLYLTFSIVKYDDDGNIRKSFCSTMETPMGPAMPACCTADPWDNALTQSVISVPELTTQPEKFSYKGFNSFMDVGFDESSYSFDDSLMSLAMQQYINNFIELNYKVTDVDLKGYASPGGIEDSNIVLSQKRADVVAAGLKKYNNGGLKVNAKGMGEDWNKVKELTQRSNLSADQKDQVLAIANSSITNDEKEAELRKVPFWEQLVDQVLIKTRHTYSELNFDYVGDNLTIERFDDKLPLDSDELIKAAKKTISISGYTDGKNISKEIKTLNELLAKKAKPNLYALRASYYLAQGNTAKALKDLDKASQLDKKNKTYNDIINGYKLRKLTQSSFEERLKLYNEYKALAEKNPGNRDVFFTKAMLMDKIGFLSGALEEYDKLLDGNKASAVNLNNRGVARIKANMFTQAQEDLEQAVKLDPDLGEAYYNLALLSAYRGYTNKTIEHLDNAIKAGPGFKRLIFNNPVFSVMSEDPRFEKFRK